MALYIEWQKRKGARGGHPFRLGLLIVANQLKAKNDEVRQLIAQRGAA